MTAIGPNEKIITDVGRGSGAYKYTNSVPTIPSDLPPGFNELYKG